MQRKHGRFNDLALEIALENLKGFALKSGGDEDATTKPEARVNRDKDLKASTMDLTKTDGTPNA